MPIALGADDIPSKSQSTASRVATRIDKHETDVRSLDRRFVEAVGELEKDYAKQRRQLREKLINSLRREVESHATNGELDQAVALREQIRSLENAVIIAPRGPAANAGDLPTSPSRESGIIGTWRWNNGVDITNLAGGNTSGNGTWRIVDPRKKEYEFRWSRIPPDRVKLSPNGRVLEGTKSNDPTFRVWAVRID